VGGTRDPSLMNTKQEGDGGGGGGGSSSGSGGEEDRSKLFTFSGVAPAE